MSTDPTTTATRLLREVVAARLDENWAQFERMHPHLAAAIERTRLIESTVHRIAADPAYGQAVEAAAKDEAAAELLGKLSAIADRWLRIILGI